MSRMRSQLIGIMVCLVGREKCMGRPLLELGNTKLYACDQHYNADAAKQYETFLKEHKNELLANFATGRNPLPDAFPNTEGALPDRPPLDSV